MASDEQDRRIRLNDYADRLRRLHRALEANAQAIENVIAESKDEPYLSDLKRTFAAMCGQLEDYEQELEITETAINYSYATFKQEREDKWHDNARRT